MCEMKKEQIARILVVDDNESIHEDFRAILSGGDGRNAVLEETKSFLFGEDSKPVQQQFEVESAYQGREGMEKVVQAAESGRGYVMAFVDVRMPPGWDGLETIKRIWEREPTLQIVICTAHSDYSWSDMIGQLGQTDRLLILKKPFDSIEVRQIACALTEKWRLLNNLDQMVKEQTAEITETRDVTVFALANLAESRDPETGAHLERIRSYCRLLADELRRNGSYSSEIDERYEEDLYRSSPLHDIGKVGIPDRILLKPGSLTQEEFEIMKQHSVIGAAALERTVARTNTAGFLKMAADIARHHHERFNGQGYPDGLKGDQIPLAARIVALADVYDALTTSRVYKPMFKPEVAKLTILDEKGKHFDPLVVEAYLNRNDDFLRVQELAGRCENEVLSGSEAN